METKPKKLKLTIEQKIEKSKLTEARRKEYQANYYKNLRSGLGSLTQDECKARQRLYFKTYRTTHGNYASNKESILKYQKTQKGIEATQRKIAKKKEKALNIILNSFLPDTDGSQNI